MNNKIVYTTQWVARDRQKEYPHGWGFDAPIVEFSQEEDPAIVAKFCREKLSNDEFECIGAIPRQCLLFTTSPPIPTVGIVEQLEKGNPYPQEDDSLPWLVTAKTSWHNCCSALRELIAAQPDKTDKAIDDLLSKITPEMQARIDSEMKIEAASKPPAPSVGVLEKALEKIKEWCEDSGLTNCDIGNKQHMAIYHSLHLAKEALTSFRNGAANQPPSVQVEQTEIGKHCLEIREMVDTLPPEQFVHWFNQQYTLIKKQ